MAVELRDGRPVLVREGGEVLRAEAATLGLLAGPGVPEVVDVRDDGQRVRVVTVVVPPLACGPGEAVLVCAQVADVLARAHAAGIAHGPILDEHLRGGPAAVVLDGWGGAGAGDPADDVAEVGALLARLGGEDPVVRALAVRTTAPGRPSAAGLAAALRAALPRSPAARPRPSVQEVGQRHGGVLLAVVVAVALLATAHGLIGARGAGTERGPTAAARPATTSSTPATTTTSTAVAPVALVDGNVVERAGARWSVGRPDDVVVVGDWDCDGEPTPAVLRPATGEVWLFPAWAGADHPTAGRTVTTVPGAVAARARPGPDACDRLEVGDGRGQWTPVA